MEACEQSIRAVLVQVRNHQRERRVRWKAFSRRCPRGAEPIGDGSRLEYGHSYRLTRDLCQANGETCLAARRRVVSESAL